MSTFASAQTFELLTPCFCSGVSKSQPEMRIASIRGQLRWWARVLYGTGRPEYELFGGIKGKSYGYAEEGVASSFKLTLSATDKKPEPCDAMLVPHKLNRGAKDTRYKFAALPPNSFYTLEWAAQSHPDFRDKPSAMINGQSRRQRFEQVVKAWLLLGTIGRRGSRAAGSVWPAGFEPEVDQFNELVTGLALPSALKVAVLDKAVSNPCPNADELRNIADLTVHGLKRNHIKGDPLGYVDGKERKASPLKFKVGRFANGFRLIAIWDNRNERGGSLDDAKAALRAKGNGNQLATWLTAAGF